MAALRQPSHEARREAPAVAFAGSHLERVQAGLPRALLATPPTEVRRIAAQALEADRLVDRRLARVGEQPSLDPAAGAEAVRAWQAYSDAQAAREDARVGRHLLLARGNAFGLCLLGLAAVLSLAGLEVMSTPVVAGVMGAPFGPVAAAVIGVRRVMAASRAVATAHQQWADRLDAAGVPTMGDLAARRLCLAAWERRRQEAELVQQWARPRQRAWQRLAGPGTPPEQVDAVLARVEQVRQAHLRVLAARLQQRAGCDVAPPAGGWGFTHASRGHRRR